MLDLKDPEFKGAGKPANSLPFPHCLEFHSGASRTGPAGAPAPPLADPIQAGVLLEALDGKEKSFLHYLDFYLILHYQYHNTTDTLLFLKAQQVR